MLHQYSPNVPWKTFGTAGRTWIHLQINQPVKPTRNSAIADKPRDAFRGQSRSPNMFPFYDRYGFLLAFYSKFVSKTSKMRWLQKCCDLENRVKGPWRSL